MSKLRMDQQTDRNASLREVMSSYPTGVTIVAAREQEGDPFGLTVNSFTSLSLEPPLVLVCIGHGATSHDRLIASSVFSVNLLSGGQGAVATRFAADPSEGRFDDIVWEPDLGDANAELCKFFLIPLDDTDHGFEAQRLSLRV
ncbi:MAG: flavin reductase family protein, partial [Longimicrobiales bacterium]